MGSTGFDVEAWATFVIDRHGVVRWRFVEVDDRIRASNEQIIDALGRRR